jgi:hypothetical protein
MTQLSVELPYLKRRRRRYMHSLDREGCFTSGSRCEIGFIVIEDESNRSGFEFEFGLQE